MRHGLPLAARATAPQHESERFRASTRCRSDAEHQDMVAAITIHNFSGYIIIIIYFSGDYFKVWCD